MITFTLHESGFDEAPYELCVQVYETFPDGKMHHAKHVDFHTSIDDLVALRTIINQVVKDEGMEAG